MGAPRGHMVSKGYIAAWADSHNTVDVIDIQDRRGFQSSIRTATAVSNVYDSTVLSHDLERTYSTVESAGTRAIVKLREDAQSLTHKERDDLVAFLDMHLDRGRHADRARLRTPALVLKTTGKVEQAELRLGDAIGLSQGLPEVVRLHTLGLNRWEWRVWPIDGLITGDGAVLLWRPMKDADICTISFPLSPTRLLIIGDELPDGVPINGHIVSNCKRWIIGQRGSLNLDWAEQAGPGVGEDSDPRSGPQRGG